HCTPLSPRLTCTTLFRSRRVAAQEFDESIAWYDGERKGLGQEFRTAIEEYFQRITDNPEWFPKVRGGVRRAVVRRFPFVIHFLIDRKSTRLNSSHDSISY